MKKKKSDKIVDKISKSVNVSFNSGGSGGITTRISLPSLWLQQMGINVDDKKAEITFHPRTKKITIRKMSSETSIDDSKD